MLRLRFILLIGVSLVLFGSLAATGGYACYLRSDAYRRLCVDRLTEYLDLPSEIGGVSPRGRNSHEFSNVAVFLPDRRGKALVCHEALVIGNPTAKNPDAYDVELRGGVCFISTATWLKGDYRHVLESGLRPSFDPGGPEQVRFSRMDVGFTRDAFRLLLHDAAGRVTFLDSEHGTAEVSCRTLNGHVATEFVTLHAKFSPQSDGIRIDETELRVPRLPIEVLALGNLLGTKINAGEFDGRLVYTEGDGGRRVQIGGSCFNVDLAEWTAPFTPTPWHGVCSELELVECSLVNRTLERLRFRGVLRELRLGDVLATWGLGGIGGRLTLRVGEAEFTPEGIVRLVASGQCLDVSLDALSERLGWGMMTGNARLLIDDLSIEQNRVRSMSARIAVDDAAERPNKIEGRLVKEIVNRALHIQLPPILPETIDYTRFGVRLDVKDETLYVLGTHGDGEKTILTVRLFGQDLPLMSQPASSFDMRPWLDPARAALLTGIRERLDALARRPLTTMPATGE